MKIKKVLAVILLAIYLITLLGNLNDSKANIEEGDTILLQGDHECANLVQFYMASGNWWSYKVIWYVYYNDPETGERYPAFCVEPAKNGVGISYEEYNASLSKDTDSVIWRILSKGYMGSTYQSWNLECDDDLYSATKIAIHSYKEGTNPKGKYRVGQRSVDGLSLEEIQRRGTKVLDVAEALYEYGVNGNETYVEPSVNISKQGEGKLEIIDGKDYYVQNYLLTANRTLISYDVSILGFIYGTKILDSNNKEKSNFTDNKFKIAIPVTNLEEDVSGTIEVKNAKIKTCPVYFCRSSIESAQSYVTYTIGFEYANAQEELKLKSDNSNLALKKIDIETKKSLEGVKFKITNEKDEILGEYTTDKNGEIKLNNLRPGTIYVQEISAPKEYKVNNEKQKVVLRWGETSKIEISNELKKGELKIVKIDEENKKKTLQGVEFDLLDENKNVVKHVITDKNGEAVITNLSKGKYILKETKTQNEYVLDEKEYKVEIKPGETTKIEITNKLEEGSLKIIKVDGEDNTKTLEGVEFDLLDENKNVIKHVITDKNGEIKIENLKKGEYTLKETKTIDGYVLDKATYKVEVKPGKTSEIKVENEKVPEIPNVPEQPKLPRTGF